MRTLLRRAIPAALAVAACATRRGRTGAAAAAPRRLTAQSGLRAARRPARRWSTAAPRSIRSAPSRSSVTKRPPSASRPSSTGSPRKAGRWAAKAVASSRCSAASRSNAARSTTRSSRCAQTSTACSPISSACKATPPTARASAAPSWRRSDRTIAVRNTSSTPIAAAAAILREPVRRRHHHHAGRAAARRRRRHLSHRVRAHLRRLLLPDLLFDDAGKLPAGRAGLPADVPGGGSGALQPSQSGRGYRAGDLDRRAELFRAAERVRVPQGVQSVVQLPRRRARPGSRRSSTSKTTPSSKATSS